VREDGEQEDEDRADEEAVRQQRRRQDHLAWRGMDRSRDTCESRSHPYGMLCYGMLWYAMVCYAMLC
jgi:hypothetical protein